MRKRSLHLVLEKHYNNGIVLTQEVQIIIIINLHYYFVLYPRYETFPESVIAVSSVCLVIRILISTP